MAQNKFHCNHLIRVLSIVEEGVGFIKTRVVITISRFFFFLFFSKYRVLLKAALGFTHSSQTKMARVQPSASAEIITLSSRIT